MVDESDGIEEAFDGQLRVLVTAAGQIGERIARQREDALRRAQAHSEQEARELQSRLAAEQRAARAELAAVHRNEWWDRATPAEVGRAYQVARAWSREDPEAVRAEQRIRDEVRTRYGVDVDNAGGDPAAVRAAVERSQQEATDERARAAEEAAAAQQLMRQAAYDEHRAAEARAAAEHEPDPAERARSAADAERREAEAGANYDTAARRENTAAALHGQGIEPEVVATRMRADVSQGTPATEAVKEAGKRAPKARRTRGAGTQLQRTGLQR